MSATKGEITSVLKETAAASCWRQWRALTNPMIAGGTVTTSIIDPEALLLLSLTARHWERRLQDVLVGWASAGSSLISVQRTQTLLSTFPESVRNDLGWFASLCTQHGDRRWRNVAQQCRTDASEVASRPGKGPDELMFLVPSTLVLRLRAGFGVGAKADLLAFLIGIASTIHEREAWASVDTIAKAITYASASVRRAAADMALARFLSASADRPTQYCAHAQTWAKVLGLSDPRTGEPSIPPWRFWAQMYAFLAESLHWAEETGDLPTVVQASRARDITERYSQTLRWNNIATPDGHAHPGELYLDAFESLIHDVSRWVDAQL